MRKIEICDTHNDFLTELKPCEFEDYIVRCKSLGAKRICASYWSTRRNNPKKELESRANILKKCDSDFLLHIEDLCWVRSEEDLAFLLELKPFSCSLTWNDENVLAGGSKSDAGLTAWGEHCLKRLMDIGVVVDVAHLNRKSFWQVANLLKKNIYCSHAGFCGVKKHKRNLTDRQVDHIVSSGGFVGLFFFDKCIECKHNKNEGAPFGVEDIVKNLKYFTSRWGLDNIGFGTDFYGIDNPPQGLEDYDGFENLFDAMKLAGFSEEQIRKIFEDFLRRV